MLRSAHTGNHVLALCVDKVLTVEDVLAGSGVAGECHACSRRVAHISVNHGLYVDCRTPLFRNLVHAAIQDCALVHPAVEHCIDSAPQLLPSRFWEVLACRLLHSGFKLHNKALEVVNGKLGVVLHALLFLNLVKDFLKRIDVLFRLRLHAENNVAIHLHEAAVAVPCEAWVARLLGESLHYGVVDTEVEHCVHHTWHRNACARTNGYEKWVHCVAKRIARKLLNVGNRFLDIFFQYFHNGFTAESVIFCANFSCDCKARRNRYADEVHLSEIGTLAAKQVLHIGTAFCLAITESVNPFH